MTGHNTQESHGFDAARRGHGNINGDGSGGILIIQGQAHAAMADFVGELDFVDRRLFLGDQVVHRHFEQVRILDRCWAKPGFEMGSAGDVGRQPCVVEGPHSVVFVVETALCCSNGQVAGFVAHRGIGGLEVMALVLPITFDQRVMNEHLACGHGVVPVHGDESVSNDWQSV